MGISQKLLKWLSNLGNMLCLTQILSEVLYHLRLKEKTQKCEKVNKYTWQFHFLSQYHKKASNVQYKQCSQEVDDYQSI